MRKKGRAYKMGQQENIKRQMTTKNRGKEEMRQVSEGKLFQLS